MSNIVVDAESTAPIEESTTNEVTETVEVADTETTTDPTSEVSETAEYEVPEKFAGKSLEDVIGS